MKHMDLTLIVGPDHPDRFRCFNIPKCTTLTLPWAWEGPAEASVLGTVDGSRAAPDDPVHALLTFDGVPIKLWRR